MNNLSKKLLIAAALFVVAGFSTTTFSENVFVGRTSAEPNCEDPSPGDLDYCIDKIQEEIDALAPAHEKNKEELANLRSQINSIESRIGVISNQLSQTEQEIGEREEELAFAQEIFEEKASNHYKFLRFYDPLAPFLFSEDAAEAFRQLNFRQVAADEDRKIMEKYAQDLYQLKLDKEKLEQNQNNLASAKSSLDERASFLGEEVAKVESYIASLSSRQQQFIAQKQESLDLPKTLGAGPLVCVDDREISPGFSPAFAFYTYGIPHRVGMNQYGALGRANAGQSATDILNAYYNNVQVTGGFEGQTVVVNGTNEFGQTFSNQSMNVEDYLKHLYEMPTSWPAEALKAQAIAARSYALRVQGEKGFLYPSQRDQVVKKELNSSAWQSAVDATRGQVVAQGGEPVKAWYASTSGGYTFTSAEVWGGSTGWTKNLRDTTGNVGSFGDLNSLAYDKSSPCFYAAQGWRGEYSNSAWLKPEEVADIANVILLAKQGVDTSHLYQVDKPNPEGVETWSMEKVKQELSSRGVTPIESASDVSVTGVDLSSGRTTQVSVNGVSFSGSEFKNFFNLRAPANIQIVGPLYNVERK